jgi:hypothetical protein
MTELGMRALHPAVEAAVKNNSTANSGPHGDIHQSRFIPSRSPTRLCQSACVSIVFQRHADPKQLAQVFHQILSPPLGKEIKIAELPSERIYWPR